MSVTSHQEKVSHYCYIRCIASIHDYVLYYSCMLYDVYTGLVVQRSHYTHIVTTHHPHTITIITTYPKREQETQSQPHPPHRKADTEKITLFWLPIYPQHCKTCSPALSHPLQAKTTIDFNRNLSFSHSLIWIQLPFRGLLQESARRKRERTVSSDQRKCCSRLWVTLSLVCAIV